MKQLSPDGPLITSIGEAGDGQTGPRVVSYHCNEFLFASARLWARTFETDYIGSTIMRGAIGGGLAHRPYRRIDDTAGWIGLDDPNESRLPVSVKSIAETLGMPYANIWRRVDVLVRGSFLERTDSGIRLSSKTLAGPLLKLLVKEDNEIFERTVLPLLIPADAPELEATTMPKPPPNVVMRFTLDFHLRRLESFVTLFSDMTTGMVFCGINAFNIRRAYDDPQIASRYSRLANQLPNHHRQPIGIRELAREIEMAYPTVRRHVAAMQANGTIQLIVDRGYIVPDETMLQPRFNIAIVALQTQFNRMAADLSRIGYPHEVER